MLSLIAAMGENGELGKDGSMPWHLPDDLRYFKNVTMGHTIIMGGETFRNMPKLLPGRPLIVLSKTLEVKQEGGVTVCRDFSSLAADYENSPAHVFVCGGAKIYSLFLPYCKKLYLTRIHHSFNADTFMPEIDFSPFQKITSSETKENNGIAFHFEVYQRL